MSRDFKWRDFRKRDPFRTSRARFSRTHKNRGELFIQLSQLASIIQPVFGRIMPIRSLRAEFVAFLEFNEALVKPAELVQHAAEQAMRQCHVRSYSDRRTKYVGGFAVSTNVREGQCEIELSFYRVWP